MSASPTQRRHAPRPQASWGARRRVGPAAALAIALTAFAGGGRAQAPGTPAKAAPPSATPVTPAPAATESTCTKLDLVPTALITGVAVDGNAQVVRTGWLATEGTVWNAPQAVVLRNPGGELIVDLHEEREIGFLVLQGDNNDSYGVESSSDGKLYTLLWNAEPVTIGQGLRTRFVTLPKTTSARFLRVRGAGGDGFYSLSALHAYCKKPAIWPPKMIVPPKQYGWPAIDNDIMVAIKGWASAAGALLLLLYFIPRNRLQALRMIPVPLAAVALIGVWAASIAWWYGYFDLSKWPKLWERVRAGQQVNEWRQFWPLEPYSIPTFARSCFYAFSLAAFVRLCFWVIKKRSAKADSYDIALGVFGLFAFLSWWNLGHFHFDHYEHTWEHYHYYIGAKYGPELSYSRLYECTAVADMEDGFRARVQKREMRDLAVTNELGTSDAIIANPQKCKQHFTPERWKLFRDDIRFFRNQFSTERWDESQTDHGYNATPVWAIVGRLIADHGELTWKKIQWMAWIDSAFLLLMWITTLWAFGWRAMCVALLWWGFNFPARFYWNGGSFLRYDWILWMVVGICLLKKRYHFAAGMALTYSTLLRVFPGFIVAALVLKALARIVRQRRLVISRGHMRFAAGCILAMAILIPASGWAAGGLKAWPEFAQNSKKHLSTALTNNMGLKTALGYDADTSGKYLRNASLHDPFSTWKDARAYFYKKRQPILFALIFLFCVMLARAADREPDWAAACLGAGLIVMASELTCYYYGFLLTYGLLWERRKLPGVTATALAGLTCLLSLLIEWNDDHFAGMSLATVIVVVGVTALAAFSRRPRPST